MLRGVHGLVGLVEEGVEVARVGVIATVPMLVVTSTAMFGSGRLTGLEAGDQRRQVVTGDVFGEYGEFVATQTGHGVAVADRGGQPVGDLAQGAVAGLVAVLVVDLLEVVQVAEQQDPTPTGLPRPLRGPR